MALHQYPLQSYLSAAFFSFFLFSEGEQAAFSSLPSSGQGTLPDHLSCFVLRQQKYLNKVQSHRKTELWLMEQQDINVNKGLSPTTSKDKGFASVLNDDWQTRMLIWSLFAKNQITFIDCFLPPLAMFSK